VAIQARTDFKGLASKMQFSGEQEVLRKCVTTFSGHNTILGDKKAGTDPE